MQFAYLVIKLDLRASEDYDGIKVDLPSRGFGTATMNVWAQIKVSGHPGNRKLIKPKTQTIRRQNWRLCLLVNICRHYGDRGEL